MRVKPDVCKVGPIIGIFMHSMELFAEYYVLVASAFGRQASIEFAPSRAYNCSFA